MSRRIRDILGWLGISAALVVAGAAGACDSGDETHQAVGAGGVGNSTSVGGGGTAGSGGSIFTDHGPILSLEVDPAAATIDVLNGQSSPAQFSATATYEDGHVGPTDASWSFDRLDIGLIDATSGTLAAHGTLGGEGVVTAEAGGLSATATVTVVLHVEENTAGLSPAEIDAFDQPDPQASGTLLYPYDGTVFARDILAPELMWSGGAAGDVYYVHLQHPHFDGKWYVDAPDQRFLMSEEHWTQLSKGNSGDAVQVDIQRMSGATAYSAMHQSWTIAQGSLLGTIYYWAVNRGQSMRVRPGEGVPVEVFDSGPAADLGVPAPANYDGTTPPWTAGAGGKRCVSCHTVSKNGERLAGVFENNSSAPSPWGTVDLTGQPPTVMQIQPYDTRTLFVALTPDGAFGAQNDIDFTMHLRNAATGAPIATALDGYVAVADPAFSGDGSMLAFSSNVTGSYPVEFWRADLDVADFDSGTQTFSNRRQVLDAGADTVAFPSFSPDNEWIFYQRGDYSRAKYGASNVGHNDLYMVDVAGQVGEIPLDQTNGVGVLDPSNRQLNYQPNSFPIAVGGYYWIVFFSPRDLGNRMVSSGDPTYQNRKQLWVAAVDAAPQAGQDPSHPAFWLRGQDLATINMKGYWVLDPCKQEGDSCDAGYECCTGFCRPDDNGDFVCSPPEGCSQVGETCEADADCCDYPEVLCVGGYCSLAPPT